MCPQADFWMDWTEINAAADNLLARGSLALRGGRLTPPAPLPLHRLQTFRHLVGPPNSPFVQPPSHSEGMKAAQLSPFAGCGCVAGFTSFPLPEEEEAACTLITLICTLSAFMASVCQVCSLLGCPVA